jgi:hypothetical protein
MMITEAKFTGLTLQEKIKILYTKATFIVAIRYYGYKINLYLLNSFYVEVFYNHKEDKIDKIEVMEKSHTRMKFYADQIRLPNI